MGLVDAPGDRFVFSLYDAGEIRVADFSDPANPEIRKFEGIGLQPYDGLITPDGRYYLAGLFGEDGVALLDFWNLDEGVRRILDGYGRGEEPLPVYKMPHLEGWAAAGDVLILPAVGRHELLVVDRDTWQETGRIEVRGQPIFAVARPDGRQVWVDFAHPDNDDFFFDQKYRHVVGSARDGERAVVVHLDVRREIAELPLPGLPHLGSGISWDWQGRRVMATPHLKEGAVSVIDMDDWEIVKTIETLGTGFFMRSHENSPYAWVDVFFGPHKDALHVIDKQTLEIAATLRPEPGKTAAHVEFTRDGRFALVSV